MDTTSKIHVFELSFSSWMALLHIHMSKHEYKMPSLLNIQHLHISTCILLPFLTSSHVQVQSHPIPSHPISLPALASGVVPRGSRWETLAARLPPHAPSSSPHLPFRPEEERRA